MGNEIIKCYGHGNNIPNKGINVIHNAQSNKYYLFEDHACIENQNIMKYSDITDNSSNEVSNLEMKGDLLKCDNSVFTISHNLKSIIRMNFYGFINAKTSLYDSSDSNDATYACVSIKTNGSHVYGLCESKIGEEPFIKKYNSNLGLEKIIRPSYISNIPIEQLKRCWSVIDNDTFAVTEVNEFGQKITFFTENGVTEEICEVSNGSKKYKFKTSDNIYVLNSNYMILADEISFMIINIFNKTMVQHCGTESMRPNITIIDNYEFMVIVGDHPAYFYIPKNYPKIKTVRI